MAEHLVDTATEDIIAISLFAQLFDYVPMAKSGPMANMMVDTATEDFFHKHHFPRCFIMHERTTLDAIGNAKQRFEI